MLDVIVLNSHGVGQYAYTDRMPKWGETLSVSRWHVAEDGGKGSNVSVALGRLGVNTAYIGKVGNDPWGDLGEKWMKESGVNTEFLYRTDEVSTGTGLILIGPNGENSIIDGDSSSVKLTFEEVEEAINRLHPSKYLIAGFEIRPSLVLKACEVAKSKGMIVALNPSPLEESKEYDFSSVDYLFINETELFTLTKDITKVELINENVLKLFRDKYKFKTLILTLGSEGSLYFDGNKIVRFKSVKVDSVVNTAGAGDGFMAAVIANLCKGKSLDFSMKWASYYSALSVTINGTIPSYRPTEEVERFIKTLNK